MSYPEYKQKALTNEEVRLEYEAYTHEAFLKGMEAEQDKIMNILYECKDADEFVRTVSAHLINERVRTNEGNN